MTNINSNNAVKSDKFVLIAHGTEEETTQAREIINRTNPEAAEHHQPARTPDACLV